MPIQIDMTAPDFCLEDAIAYEFFMENVNVCFEDKEQTGEEVATSIVILARSAYLVARSFTEARDAYNNSKEEVNGED